MASCPDLIVEWIAEFVFGPIVLPLTFLRAFVKSVDMLLKTWTTLKPGLRAVNSVE